MVEQTTHTPEQATRKIIQIAVTPDTDSYDPVVFALCDDGTVWLRGPLGDDEWRAQPPIPQPSDGGEG